MCSLRIPECEAGWYGYGLSDVCMQCPFDTWSDPGQVGCSSSYDCPTGYSCDTGVKLPNCVALTMECGVRRRSKREC
jgi:hypothetical protein